MIIDGLTGVGLMVLAVCDWRKHEIAVLPTVFGGVLLFFLRMGEGIELVSLLFAFLPGIFLLFLSIVSRGSIGIGDGIVLCALGAGAGLERTLCAFGSSLLFCGIIAGVLLLLKKVKRKTELPYVPFLFLGYVFSFFAVL